MMKLFFLSRFLKIVIISVSTMITKFCSIHNTLTRSNLFPELDKLKRFHTSIVEVDGVTLNLFLSPFISSIRYDEKIYLDNALNILKMI